MSVETSNRPVDHAERQRGLDPLQSFIVQAPAGSGKTELLTQRYLRLLSGVDQPESVIAITFTRKAAAEMRHRIMKALRAARDEPAPAEEHARQTWELAGDALKRDADRAWELLDNPRRFRVVTIDSLSARIARLQPVHAGVGSTAEPAEDVDSLYRRAAKEALAPSADDDLFDAPLRLVLDHLGNDERKLARMLVDMLRGRDQWMRHVFDNQHEREDLEAVLSRVVDKALNDLHQRFSPAQRAEVERLSAYARGNLLEQGLSTDCTVAEFPGGSHGELEAWQALANFLMTKSGTWRKSADKNIGFPAPSGSKDSKELAKQWKSDFVALVDGLRADPALETTMAAVRELPDTRYTDRQWQVLEALRAILRLAVANLEVVFKEQGQVDYAAVAMAAMNTLRDNEAMPSEVALALDYRIEHLLVDEFQDTSVSQWHLLELLTEAWAPGDGRTLFVVGDPMQSIYRFRQAEVGLFLRAQTDGIGNLPLEPLTLRANFRSQAGVVDWVNSVFPSVLGQRMDIAEGAVAYAASEPVKSRLPGDAVRLHTLGADDAGAEAQRVLDILHESPPGPENRVAILVRGRAHLSAIIPALRGAGHRFQAVEIDTLAQRPVIQDLLALTRALLHPADRVAWLSVFRAPWCALPLQDLHRLSHWPGAAVLADVMRDVAFCETLGSKVADRWERTRSALLPALDSRGRVGLRAWVGGCWLALGGPACVDSATDLEDAERYLELLDQFDVGCGLDELAAFESAVERLFAEADVQAGTQLQLMTIHKAKGLEFETVILPGLNRRPRADDTKLLLWMEAARAGHGSESSEFLLAPVKADAEDSDSIYRYVKRLEQRKGEHELARLLYVAATRAIQRLHLLASFKEKKAGDWSLAPGSLLKAMWPATQAVWQSEALPPNLEQDEARAQTAQPIRYLEGDWVAPSITPVFPLEVSPEDLQEEDIEFSWAGETARHVALSPFLQDCGLLREPPRSRLCHGRLDGSDLTRRWLH
ncbi:MAG: UvrD-helicase domain-containing protein, partial [Gammaproteobacteria bacterium]